MNEISYDYSELKDSVTPLNDVQNEYSSLLNSLQGISLSSELSTASLLDDSISSINSLLSSEISSLRLKLANILSLADNIEISIPSIFKRLFGFGSEDVEDENLSSVDFNILYSEEYQNV